MAVPHGHWNTTTFVAGLTQRGMIAPFVIAGAVTKDGAADDLVDRECEQGEHQLAEHLGVPADTHRVAAARVLEAGVGPLDDRADAVPDALRPDEAARARGRSSRFISSPDVARALARLVGLLLAGVANRTEHPAPARHIKPFGTVRNPLEPE